MVGSSGCKQILATFSGESDIATILIPGWKTYNWVSRENFLTLIIVMSSSNVERKNNQEEWRGTKMEGNSTIEGYSMGNAGDVEGDHESNEGSYQMEAMDK